MANSGQKVQNFMQGTTHVIAVSADSARISNLIHRHQINVIHPKWVIDCDK